MRDGGDRPRSVSKTGLYPLNACFSNDVCFGYESFRRGLLGRSGRPELAELTPYRWLLVGFNAYREEILAFDIYVDPLFSGKRGHSRRRNTHGFAGFRRLALH